MSGPRPLKPRDCAFEPLVLAPGAHALGHVCGACDQPYAPGDRVYRHGIARDYTAALTQQAHRSQISGHVCCVGLHAELARPHKVLRGHLLHWPAEFATEVPPGYRAPESWLARVPGLLEHELVYAWRADILRAVVVASPSRVGPAAWYLRARSSRRVEAQLRDIVTTAALAALTGGDR